MLNICHFLLSPTRRVHPPLLTVLVGQLVPGERDSVGCRSLTGITLSYPYARYEAWWQQTATRSGRYCSVPLRWTGGGEDTPMVTEEQGKRGVTGRVSEIKSLSISIIVLCYVPQGIWQCTVELSLTGSVLTINSPSSSGEEGLELACPKGAFFLSKSYKQGQESHFPWGLLFSVM